MGKIFRDKILVGITGGIGSGKSEVCRMLAKSGYKVIFADFTAKDLYKTDKKLASTVVKAFGKEILNYQGVISLAKLREIVFKNKSNFRKINKIVHPAVIKHLMNYIKPLKQKIILIESALVFDTAFHGYLDYVIMVYSNKKNRIDRIVARDGAKKTDVEKIMSYQLDERIKIEKSDFVVVNNKSFNDLEKDIHFLGKLLKFLN